MNGREIATLTCVCLYQQPVTWILLGQLSDSAQSNPFIENYYLIIVASSHPHFSIHDISYTKESTLSFKARATHFKGSVTVRGVGMFMRFFEKSYKV